MRKFIDNEGTSLQSGSVLVRKSTAYNRKDVCVDIELFNGFDHSNYHYWADINSPEWDKMIHKLEVLKDLMSYALKEAKRLKNEILAEEITNEKI